MPSDFDYEQMDKWRKRQDEEHQIELIRQRDFFLRWLCEVRRSMTREAHEDGRTEAEILEDISCVLGNFGCDAFTCEPEQVNEHERLMSLPRTYHLRGK